MAFESADPSLVVPFNIGIEEYLLLSALRDPKDLLVCEAR
jgi:hypothetical protein